MVVCSQITERHSQGALGKCNDHHSVVFCAPDPVLSLSSAQSCQQIRVESYFSAFRFLTLLERFLTLKNRFLTFNIEIQHRNSILSHQQHVVFTENRFLRVRKRF